VTTASAIGPFTGILLNQRFGFESIFVVSLIVIIIAFVFSLLIKGLPKPEPLEDDDDSSTKGINAYIQKEALTISFIFILFFVVFIFVGTAYINVISFFTVYK